MYFRMPDMRGHCCALFGLEFTWSLLLDERVESNQGVGDDTAVNGITLICTSQGNRYINIMSDYGKWGCWTLPLWCPYGHLSAFRLQVKSSQGAGDDSAVNNIDFKCSHGSMLTGQGLSYGTHGSWSNDCGKNAICGLRTKIEKSVGARDDTALNDVQFYCCE
uniref:vitelline membrane outer layer protein 1 homolog isoform X2 n=1 Tax=Myxine glutinosa TaxID=7769 RepID=UPI00358FA151